MQSLIDAARDILITIAHWIPQFIGALLILLIGYIVSRSVEGIVRKALSAAGFDKVLTKGTAGSYIERVVRVPSKLVGSVVFWLLWLGTLSLAVTILGIPALTNFVNAIYAYVPNIIAAVLIFLVAGAVSAAAAAGVTRVMGDTPTGKIVATVVPTITMLIATFMILDELQIAHQVVLITYSAIMGAVALGMALAFGLGGRDVAASLLGTAYDRSRSGMQQAKSDIDTVKERTHNNHR